MDGWMGGSGKDLGEKRYVDEWGGEGWWGREQGEKVKGRIGARKEGRKEERKEEGREGRKGDVGASD